MACRVKPSLQAVAIVANMLALGFVWFLPLLRAQSNSQDRLRFDAASVKLAADQNIQAKTFTRKGSHITWSTDLGDIIEYAIANT